MTVHPTTQAKNLKQVFVLIILLIVVSFGTWTMLSFGIKTLHDGTITYTGKGLSPKTVSPSSGAFEYYYQVAFFLTLPAFYVFFSAGFGLAKLADVFPRHSSALKAVARVVLYCAVSFGLTWVLLRFGRHWLL